MPSFPYTTTSPPPTAGPLPVIERANLTTPYAAGGGGGGGGLQSSIQLGPSFVVCANDGSQDVITQAAGAITFNTADAISMIGANIQLESGSVFTLTPGTTSLSTLSFDVQYNLNVSSINNAAPNGGGVNPAGISTAQVAATASTLTLAANGSSVITIDDTKTIAIELRPKSGTGSIRLNGYSTIVEGDLNVSSINGTAYIPGLKMETGVTALDAGGSTIIETDKIYLVTDPVPQVTYRGVVGPGVSSLGAEALSPSTFIVYGAPNANINWFAAGS